MTRPPIFESYSADLPPPGDEQLPMSKPAVFGFIFALLQCLPVLAGIGAVILGFIGLWQVRRKQAIGKPLALIAIVIGGLSIILWGVVIAAGAVVAARFAEVEETARHFVEALAEGDMDRARRLASDDLSDAQLAEWQAQFAAGDSRSQVVMWEFSFGEPDEVDLAKLWSGPYYTVGQVKYEPNGTAEPPPSRRAWVMVIREGNSFRVQDVTSKIAPMPDPEQLIEELRDLRDLRDMSRPEAPVTRPVNDPGSGLLDER